MTKDKYIYISVETDKETIVELIAQILPESGYALFPFENDIQIFNPKENITTITLDFTSLNDEVTLILTTIYGKAKINLDNESIDYVTDVRENKLFFVIDIENSYKGTNTFNLIINKLESDDVNKLGYIFYLSYMKKSNNILKEITYSKSSKWIYDKPQFTIMFYERIPNIQNAINVNLQFFNIPFNASINKDILVYTSLYLKTRRYQGN